MSKPKVNLKVPGKNVEVEVKCPTCSEKRIITMFWTGGNITPRIRCNPCKSSVRGKSRGLPVYAAYEGIV